MKKHWVYAKLILYILISSQLLADQKKPKQVAVQKNMTQSEAHMSVPLINKMVQKWYSFKKNPYFKQLYEDIVKQEKKFNDSHYVFYNAFSNEWRVPQDLYLKLYERLHPLTIDINDFRAFRWMPVDHKTPTELISEEMRNHGLVNDHELRLKTYLLSTNLALFGNTEFPGECTFEYYINAKSNTKVNEAIFKGILDIFDDPTQYPEGVTPILYKYLPEISSLDEYLVGEKLPNGKEPQSLAQIFIPKSMADTVAYIAWVEGIPYDAQLANWVLTTIKKSPGSIPTYPPAQTLLTEIRELFKDQQENHPLFKSIFKGIEEGKYHLSTFLDQYKATPYLIPGLNNIQARLIISPQYIGSIGAGIKVLTYDRIPEEKKKLYEEKLDKIVNKIFKDILARAQEATLALQSNLTTDQQSTDSLANDQITPTSSSEEISNSEQPPVDTQQTTDTALSPDIVAPTPPTKLRGSTRKKAFRKKAQTNKKKTFKKTSRGHKKGQQK